MTILFISLDVRHFGWRITPKESKLKWNKVQVEHHRFDNNNTNADTSNKLFNKPQKFESFYQYKFGCNYGILIPWEKVRGYNFLNLWFGEI